MANVQSMQRGNPWLIACRSRELRGGRPLALLLENRPVVLFRDAAGHPVALEDRCAHRNAPLSLGQVRRGTLECRYHGWRYGAAGDVVDIPALDLDAARGSAYRARRYATTEQDGFVWVALDDPNPACRPLPFPYHRAPGWTTFVLKTRFAAPVDVCLENFLDCPHATFVHRYWFRAPTAKSVKAEVRTLEDGAEAEFFDEPRERSVVWWLLAPRGGTMRHTDRFIAPRTSRVDYVFPSGLHYVITSSCTAVTDAETDVHTVISFRAGRLGPLVRLVFEPLARRIIRQDVVMVNAQWANVERFGGPRYACCAADVLGPHVRAWRRALSDGASPPVAGTRADARLRL